MAYPINAIEMTSIRTDMTVELLWMSHSFASGIVALAPRARQSGAQLERGWTCPPLAAIR